MGHDQWYGGILWDFVFILYFFPVVWVMVEIRTLYLNDSVMVVISKNLGRQK